MAITATVKVKGYVQGYGAGRMEIDTTPFTDSSALPSVRLSVAAGDNTITVPTGSVGVIISMEVSNSVLGKTLKGVAGDTGIQIFSTGLAGSFFFPLASTVTSFVINSVNPGASMEFRFI